MDEPELRRAHVMREVLGGLDDNLLLGKPVLATPTLQQNEVWRTKDGKVVYLDEMEPSHRYNLLRYLERNCVTQMLRHDLQWFNCGLAPQGEMATQALTDMLLEDERDPLERLKETPFYQRLAWLVERDEDDE